MSAIMLEIDGLVTTYGKTAALQGVSLTLQEGSINCLLGPNGAGKSTLLMSIAGLIRTQRGTIRFCGVDIMGKAPHRVGAHGIALVPENRQLFATLSVADNLLVGACWRADKGNIATDLERMYKRFPQIRERAGQQAGTLSGGEQQLLAMARAMMSRPKLLLMDEPSRGLSPLAVEDMLCFIGQINAQGTSVLFAEQNPHLALRFAQHLYLLEKGRITFSGDPAHLPEDEVARRAYLGSAMSVLQHAT